MHATREYCYIATCIMNYIHGCHSNAGCSRSSAVALAYVMSREKITLMAALQRLRKTRPCVQPNQSFMEQLTKLEQQLGLAE